MTVQANKVHTLRSVNAKNVQSAHNYAFLDITFHVAVI